MVAGLYNHLIMMSTKIWSYRVPSLSQRQMQHTKRLQQGKKVFASVHNCPFLSLSQQESHP